MQIEEDLSSSLLIKQKLQALAESIEIERKIVNADATIMSFTDPAFIQKMQPLEKMINYYLRSWKSIGFARVW